ncbi:UDP-glucose 4-epimerase GalE [soil metagenome]
MNILVTGGAGYVGSVAVELLLDAGHSVAVIDNLAKGHAAALSSDVQFFAADLRNSDEVRQAMRSGSPDAVMHFGAVTIVPESVNNPGKYYAVNTTGTINLLEAMIEIGVERLVFSSTAAVYGSPSGEMVSEIEPLSPISPYGSSKLMAEQVVADFSAAYDLEYSIFRYFNVAGATESRGEDHTPETHLIPSAILAARGLREPLAVFGRDYPTLDGTAIRDYVHVVDLVKAHILALNAPSARNEIFNLGAGRGSSVAEVIAAVESVSGQPLPIMEGPRRSGDPAVLVADNTKAMSHLTWRPDLSTLSEIVQSAWDWIDRHPYGYRDLP